MPGHPGAEVGPAALERQRLLQVAAVPDLLPGRVHRRVEDHTAHTGREQVRVQRAEVRPVRRAHEGQPLLAECRPQHIEIARVVDRGVIASAPVPACRALAAAYSPRLGRTRFLS
ncbi:hypothetical protein SSCG_05615 [Streptomyces clavuligerus]|nr:hypothetical protein SSCG_05615 [Streptomyces clavuligerus]